MATAPLGPVGFSMDGRDLGIGQSGGLVCAGPVPISPKLHCGWAVLSWVALSGQLVTPRLVFEFSPHQSVVRLIRAGYVYKR